MLLITSSRTPAARTLTLDFWLLEPREGPLLALPSHQSDDSLQRLEETTMREPLSRVQLFVAPWTAAHQAAWDSPGKNTGVGCHALLQGIFPTQGSNLRPLHYRRILYCLSLWWC